MIIARLVYTSGYYGCDAVQRVILNRICSILCRTIEYVTDI